MCHHVSHVLRFNIGRCGDFLNLSTNSLPRFNILIDLSLLRYKSDRFRPYFSSFHLIFI